MDSWNGQIDQYFIQQKKKKKTNFLAFCLIVKFLFVLFGPTIGRHFFFLPITYKILYEKLKK